MERWETIFPYQIMTFGYNSYVQSQLDSMQPSLREASTVNLMWWALDGMDWMSTAQEISERIMITSKLNDDSYMVKEPV